MADEQGISEEAQNDQQQTEQSGDNRAASYHDRIRTEPEFAVEETRRKDSHIGALNQRLHKLKDLEPLVEAVGGPDAFIELATFGHSVRTNPELQRAIQEAANGNAKPQNREPEPEIYDTEVKHVHDKFSKIIEEQGQIIRDLQGRLNKTEVVSVKSTLRESMEKALSKFSDDTESRAEAQDAIIKAIESAERAAANGDRSAAKQLEQLAGPGGEKLLRMMTIETYDKFVEKRLAAKATPQPNGEKLRQQSTDERVSTRATPPSDVVSVRSGAKVTSQLARQVLEEATRKAGKDPNAFWG